MKKSKIEKLVRKSFDDLYKESIKISRKWNTNKTVPVKVIEEIASILIGNVDKMDLPELSSFKAEYEKTIKQIIKYCKASAKRMDSKSVPESLLKQFCDTCKEEFSKSFNNNLTT